MKTHAFLAPVEEALNRARARLFDATFTGTYCDFYDACNLFSAAHYNYLTACRAARTDVITNPSHPAYQPKSREQQELEEDDALADPHLANYDPPCPADLPRLPDAPGQLLMTPATAATRVT